LWNAQETEKKNDPAADQDVRQCNATAQFHNGNTQYLSDVSAVCASPTEGLLNLIVLFE
jgi:hypothetical protein